MRNELTSSFSMLSRAKQHISDLEGNVCAFIDSKPCINVREIDPDSGDEVYKIKLATGVPDVLSTIAADCIANLRSALDQVGYAVSVVAGRKGNETHFPFGDTAREVNSRKLGRSKEIPNEIFSLMESFKPYKGGNDLLWSMNKLWNANKHRMLTATVVATGSQFWRHMTVVGSGSIMLPVWDSARNEMVLARVRPGDKFDYDIEIQLFISFDNIDVLTRKPVIGVLNAMVSEVERILVAVETKTKRLFPASL